VRQVCRDACSYWIGAEFIDDGNCPITLHHNRRHCSVCHDELDVPPLKLRDEPRHTVERIIGIEALELQRARLLIALGGEPIA
jgi:hypothetical protein